MELAQFFEKIYSSSEMCVLLGYGRSRDPERERQRQRQRERETEREREREIGGDVKN